MKITEHGRFVVLVLMMRHWPAKVRGGAFAADVEKSNVGVGLVGSKTLSCDGTAFRVELRFARPFDGSLFNVADDTSRPSRCVLGDTATPSASTTATSVNVSIPFHSCTTR